MAYKFVVIPNPGMAAHTFYDRDVGETILATAWHSDTGVKVCQLFLRLVLFLRLFCTYTKQ